MPCLEQREAQFGVQVERCSFQEKVAAAEGAVGGLQAALEVVRGERNAAHGRELEAKHALEEARDTVKKLEAEVGRTRAVLRHDTATAKECMEQLRKELEYVLVFQLCFPGTLDKHVFPACSSLATSCRSLWGCGHGCPFRELTPVVTSFSGLRVGNERQQKAVWHPDMSKNVIVGFMKMHLQKLCAVSWE
jgi:hypothetical protein